MADYSDDIAFALEMIEEAGVQCEWHKDGTVPDNADKPWLGGAPDEEPATPFICFVPATDGNSGFGIAKLTQGGDVPQFNTYGLMGVQDFVPQETDRIVQGAKQYTVVTIDTLAPAGDPIVYILGLS